MDWVSWHSAYADPSSSLSRRLEAVREQIRLCLSAAPSGSLRAVSMCAGDGRDLLGVLASHPRAADVSARLVELDPTLAARARAAAASLPAEVSVVEGDAAFTSAYAGAVPADLALFCGVFGNISPTDIATTIAAVPEFVAPGGVVIWTRHREAPDLVPQILEWFADVGCESLYVSPKDAGFGVGAHRFVGTPRPLVAGRRLFTFER
ncbi:SAM-dependent methyltransferase [Asanoa sp. WMMD1127]|uniref:SAM-dependent methyltransferase n=1 Tax=Asanoa sp. WMMD1127 TaxID=3016107 RepID=UPI00241632C2|nr:SAM-dependent methyltransferase [Asanoa sp. WMMD1127]MDG4822560.1 SAM-dependent methyltransferase [Asanoa sp. WMMD1127]